MRDLELGPGAGKTGGAPPVVRLISSSAALLRSITGAPGAAHIFLRCSNEVYACIIS